MSKELKQDIQDTLYHYSQLVERLKKKTSRTIEREKIVMDKINQLNMKITKLVVEFKKLEENNILMTKEERKEFRRLVKIRRRETRAQFNKK